jgi:hypothetical protein
MSKFKDTDFELDPMPNTIKVVAIAGFEMPKCCIECVLYDHFTGYCAVLDECIYDEEDDSFWIEKERYTDCPLREISFDKEKEKENESE